MNYTLENGVTLEISEATRPPITFWMQSRIMPQHLTAQYVRMRNLVREDENVDELTDDEIQARMASASLQRELTDDEMLAQLDFQYKAVEYVLRKACAVQELTEFEFKLLYQFALFGEQSARLALDKKGGSASALESFRQAVQ